MPDTFFRSFRAIAKQPPSSSFPCTSLAEHNATWYGISLWSILVCHQAVSPVSLLPPPAYWLLGTEGRDKTLTPRVGSKTYWDIPGHASNVVELLCDLTKGCLEYPNETQHLLALFWVLASAYWAPVQHNHRSRQGRASASEDTMAEAGTQPKLILASNNPSCCFSSPEWPSWQMGRKPLAVVMDTVAGGHGMRE